MRPPRLRTFVSFQEQTVQRTPAGGSFTKPNTVAQAWCHAAPASAREAFVADQLRTEVDMVLHLQDNPAIKSNQGATFRDGRVFTVLAVERSDAKPGWIKVFCRQYREETQTEGAS